MAKKSSTQEANNQMTEVPLELPEVKTPRTRKISVTPTVTETTMNLAVQVIGQDTVSLDLEVGQLPQTLVNQLVLRGITNFIHDKTAGLDDKDKVVAAIQGVFTSVLENTIFDGVRKNIENVVLPKFVEAMLHRDGKDRTDLAVRKEALENWLAMLKEDKLAVRQDAELADYVTILNAEEAKARLGMAV